MKASDDHRIGPNHVALYMALVQQCYSTGNSAICLNPTDIRQLAKVGRTTYHKCMRDLAAYGYVKYTPSYSAMLGSSVSLTVFDA